MTVASRGLHDGRLNVVTSEENTGEDSAKVVLRERQGRIQTDLTIGANVAGAVELKSNMGLCCPGVKLHGAGFIVTPDEAIHLGLGSVPGLEKHIREYRNGRDLTARPRGVMVIDLFGLREDQVLSQFPAVYQWIHDRVRAERIGKVNSSKDSQEYARNWWLFGKPRQTMRDALAGLSRYIATVETAKHRAFMFHDSSILPDNMLISFAVSDAYSLGVLSSRVHEVWTLAAGGRLGYGNDPRYTKSRCFDAFPFPIPKPELQQLIAGLAEQLDAHRKKQQALHPDLTLTGMYNVLEKLRSGETLTAKEKVIHEQGLVSVLKQIHDDLDAAVFDAYGWPHDLTDEQILERLVALNAERAAEEARGLIRWLRPEFQNPGAGGVQKHIDLADDEAETPTAKQSKAAKTTTKAAQPAGKVAWPKTLSGQVQAVSQHLAAAAKPVTPEDVAKGFTRGKVDDVTELLDALVTLGKARTTRGGKYVAA